MGFELVSLFFCFFVIISQMEYYEGYLVPVGSSPADVPPHHNRPAALSRENEYLRARVKKL